LAGATSMLLPVRRWGRQWCASVLPCQLLWLVCLLGRWARRQGARARTCARSL